MKMSPKPGDMFACQICMLQVQVMNECDCDAECAEFACCDKPMKNITQPTVRAADCRSIDSGNDSLSQKGKIESSGPTVAEQAEQAKKF